MHVIIVFKLALDVGWGRVVKLPRVVVPDHGKALPVIHHLGDVDGG
jgi:hypothetical protein